MADVGIALRRDLVEMYVEAALHSTIAALPGLPEALIDWLDDQDGDPDVEACRAGDDGCHYYQRRIEGRGLRLRWLWHLPDYGIDQPQSRRNWRGTYNEGWGA
jgi:hypothetical protein